MIKYIFSFFALFLTTTILPQSVSERAAVQLSAEVGSSPARVIVNWAGISGTTSVTIYRKLKGASSWGNAIASPSSTTTSFQDNGVSVGVAYEYKVVRVSNGVTGTGYLCSGINVPMADYRGKIILLVDNTLAGSLANELTTLDRDLRADGWAVLRNDVSPTASVNSVRNIIIDRYNSDQINVKAVYIIGHVPVPYSGNVAPDGHGTHQGAWPCDGYYGELNGNWSDNSVSVQASQNPKNFNVPGDGKFDQSDFPSALELQVGRVDMNDLPAFGTTEVELMRGYLNKAHAFKIKGYVPQARAMMFDNLQWVGNPLAASGWRSIAPMVSSTQISAPYQYGPSYNSIVNGQSYLWAYASGGGLQEYIGNDVTFNGADNIGTTQSYAAGNLGGVFNMSFGSYFGDWDNKNNFLRAPLARGEGLTNAYSSIPGWYFHHMGLGDNIGYSTLVTMNNTGQYVPLTDGWQGTIGRTHLALMGDPSLRQKMVAPPSGLTITNAGGNAYFSWIASAEAISGYYIYQVDASTGAITKATNTLVTSTTFQNSSVPFVAGRQYMVRAMKMQVDPSGSYENLSLGSIASAAGTSNPTPTNDCAGVPGGSATSGTSCNDGNACTTNDTWNANCQCVGTSTTPTASLSATGSTSFCAGGSVTLNSSTGSSYVWKKDGVTISGATSSSYTATQSGTYTVTVSNGTCGATSNGVTVNATSGPSATIATPNGTSFCSGGSVVLNANTGSGFQYVWYRDGGVISGSISSSYTATQVGSYSVRVISGACYTNSSGITVSATTSSTATITPVGSTSFCSGGSVVLNASTGSSYVWKRDGTTISGATSSSYTATQSGTYTVTVSSGSCTGTSVGVSVNASGGPSATISTPGGTSFCSGGSVVMSANTGSGFQYVWYLNSNVISGATASSYTASSAGSYTVRVISGSCFTNSSAVSVTSTSSSTANITPAGSTAFCNGSVVLNASAGTGFVWKRNGSTISGATSSSYTATQSGAYTVTVSNGSCSGTSNAISVNAATSPSATITATGGTSFCTGGNVQLSANTGSGYQYVWLRNDIVISGAISSTYTATQIGSYVVRVISGACFTNSAVASVNVANTGTAVITPAGPTAFCTGGSVALNANTGTGLTYVWKRNGATISGATNSSYTAAEQGSYTVVVSNGSCVATSSSVEVNISSSLPASISASGSTNICQGDNVVLTSPSGGTYVWKRNGTVIAGATSNSYTVTTTGTYLVTVGTGACASTSVPTNVVVNAPPSAVITANGSTAVCLGQTVSLSANTGTGYLYVWRLNGTPITGATNSTYTATQAGSYDVKVILGACYSYSTTTVVSMSGAGSASIAPAGPTTFCTGGSVILNANTGSNYQWSRNGVNLLGATSSSYTASQAGNYVVTVGAGTCSGTSSPVTVTVSSVGTATIAPAGSTTFCTGGSVQLYANTGNGYSYVWKKNGTVISGATSSSYNATQAGSYTVTVNAGSCTATSSAVPVSITSNLTANLVASGPVGFCYGGSAILSTNNGSGFTYVWKRNGSVIQGATDHSFTGTEAGTYSVVVSTGNCTATSNSVTLSVGANINASITAAQQSGLCGNSGVLLSVPNANGNTYIWRKNGSAISGANSNTYTATSAAGYEVSIYNGQCVENSSIVFVSTGSGATTYITALGSTHLCNGNQVVLSTFTGSGYSHQWMRNGVYIQGANGSTYAASANGSYSVYTTYGGCSVVSFAVQIFVSSPLAVTATSSPGNSTVTANVTGGEAPYSYAWNTAPVQITSTANVSATGMYNVVVTDVNGCKAFGSAGIELGSGMAVENDPTIAEEIVKIEERPEEIAAIEVLVYPNPFKGNTNFSISGLQPEERTTIDVYSADGVLIANVFSGAVDQSGNYRLAWEAGSIPSGIYYYRLISGKRSASGKLVVE